MRNRKIVFQNNRSLPAAHRWCLWVAILCLLLTGRVGSADEAQSLQATITEGISLLEEKKYEAFLSRLPLPKELDRMRKNRSMEELARTFAKQHADRLLGMLQQIKEQKPQLSDEGRRAEYAVEWRNFSKSKLVFLKIEDRWHLHN